MMDKAARTCVRLDLPVLSQTEDGSYPVLSMSYHTSGSVQVLELKKRARRSACGIVTHQFD